MRCPKCQYISFGSADRCRNCGYEFLLSAETPSLDLPTQADQAESDPLDLADFTLSERTLARPGAAADPGTSDGQRAARPTTTSRFDLPLFGEDRPLVTPSAIPRAPLSVRRGQPAAARSRTERVLPMDDAEPASPHEPPPAVRREGHRALHPDAAGAPDVPRTVALPASAAARIFAGLIDLFVLGAIDAGVLYSTLRLLSLPLAEITSLPPVPLGVFLLLLNGGYLSIFTTAGGQTIGKMIAGIRVVADPPTGGLRADDLEGGVTMGASVLRASAYLASLLPVGLGFAAILFDSDGRALHDRLAETRVVKA